MAELDLVARTMDRWCLRQQQQYYRGNEVSPRLMAKHNSITPPPQKLTNRNGVYSDDVTSPQAVANNASKNLANNKTSDIQVTQQESDTDSDRSSLVDAMLESLDGGHMSSSSDDKREFFDAVEQSRNGSSPVEATTNKVTASLERTVPLSTDVSRLPAETDAPSSDHVDGPLEVMLS